ncbi:MAG TPA: PqqD family protein [bacterium]|nr:PqqD family protein [bacterium]
MGKVLRLAVVSLSLLHPPSLLSGLFMAFIMGLDDRFRLRGHHAAESFIDGALVLRFPERFLFELNTTARDVLMLMDGDRTIAQIISTLAVSHGRSGTEMIQDVGALVAQLVDQGIVEKV